MSRFAGILAGGMVLYGLGLAGQGAAPLPLAARSVAGPAAAAPFSGALAIPSVHDGIDRTGPAAAQRAVPATAAVPLSAQQIVDRYCVSCHNDALRTAGLSLAGLDVANPSADAATWEKVIRKLRAGLMPPAGMPRPDRASIERLRAALETGIDRAAAGRPDPGATSLHRLNRTEYAHAIRDLLAVDIDTATLLPADDSFEGFDNIADVLGTSPVLIERYVGAAARISRLAVGQTDIGPTSVTYKVRGDLSQDRHIDGLPPGTRGGILFRHTFPVDGDYDFRFSLLNVNFGPRYGGAAKDEQIEMSVNGERVLLSDLRSVPFYYIRGGGPGAGGRGGAAGGRGAAPGTPAGTAVGRGGAVSEQLEIRLPMPAGPQTVAVTFPKRSAAYVDDLVQRVESTTADLQTGVQFGYTTVPHLSSVEILGPFDVRGPGDTPSRARIFTCRPAGAAEERPCATRILDTLARRAYRRPVTADDLAPLLDFFEAGRAQGGFEAGVEMALRRLLADPQFVFRFEREPEGLGPGEAYRVSDVELASRLSFFLWSSIPDDELLEVAAAGRLREPAVLEAQVRRMLRDPKAEALVTNFAGQWLFLRELRSRTPDLLVYPDFDDNLRQALLRETELLFASVLREDRSVFDVIDADYTFVNERLARHYGIPHVYGSDFRRVPVTDEARRGVLGHGSILTVTSAPNRTSPVTRGAWILENLLGSPPPAPPPDVPGLEEAEVGQGVSEPPKTVRERMVQHRANPVCRSCHQIMDPIGLALEYFDGIGAWRTMEAGTPIDATGELVDGTVVDGPASLRRALLDYPDAFAQALTQKLLMYAIGRPVHDADMPVVRAIARAAAREEHRFSALVLGIVHSHPFQMQVRKVEDHP